MGNQQSNKVQTVEILEDDDTEMGANANKDSFVVPGGDGEAYRALLHEYRMSSTTLGEGGFGKVRLATSSRTGHQVAVKIVRRNKLVDRAELLLQREVEYHEKLRHPNIVRLFTWIKTPSRYYLVMEHCDRGDLLAYINSNSLLPMFEIKSLFSQLMHGVRFCHALGFFHRDLKLENLMLCTPQAEEVAPECGAGSTRATPEEPEDENFHSAVAPAPGVFLLKIADFGLSTLRPDTNHSTTHCGSPLYAAPELMGAGPAPRPDGNYDASKSDLWSCGVILFALLASRLPFDADNIQALISAVRTGTPSTPVPAQRGKDAAALVSQMLNIDPAARPSAESILRDPWLHDHADGRPRVEKARTFGDMADVGAVDAIGAGSRGVTLTTAAIKRMMLAERVSHEAEKAEREAVQKPAREFEVGDRRQPGSHMTRTELQNIKAEAAAMVAPEHAP